MQTPAGTQAVTRALRLFKTVASETTSPTLDQLCKKHGLAKTTAHRLLAALESEGLVVHDPRGKCYRLGPDAAALGLRALAGNDLRAIARPLLEELAADTGETATLELLAGDDVLIVDEVVGRHLIAAQAEIGTRWPLHATSTGKAILAGFDKAERLRRIQHPLHAITSASVVDPEELLAEIELAAGQGWAVASGELETWYAAVGAAFVDQSGRPLGAVSVGGPSNRLDSATLDRLGPLLKAAADRLSDRLGHS